MDNTYLCHHGVKGQKWGVRRYQNKDGSLTDEGRRAYGYGKGADRIIRKNTAQRAVNGAKRGAKIGVGVGGVLGGIAGVTLATMMVPYFGLPSAIISAGATTVANMLSYGASGTVAGLSIGGIAGAVETHRGRQYIERYDSGLAEFERRDRRG